MVEDPSTLSHPTPSGPMRRERRDAASRDALEPRSAGLLSPPRRARASEALGIEAARRLEQLIGDGTLSPGERLNEVALSRSLGVSRGPVREAVRALEKAGLVTVIMNRGAFVRSLGPEEAKDIYQINGALFGLAAALAAGGVTKPQALALHELVAAMDGANARASRDEFFHLNSKFHAFIMACSGNHEAQSLYGQMTRKLFLLRRRSFEQPGHMQDSNREHRGLLEAILTGDAERARELAERHARRGQARFLKATENQADKTVEKEEPR